MNHLQFLVIIPEYSMKKIGVVDDVSFWENCLLRLFCQDASTMNFRDSLSEDSSRGAREKTCQVLKTWQVSEAAI